MLTEKRLPMECIQPTRVQNVGTGIQIQCYWKLQPAPYIKVNSVKEIVIRKSLENHNFWKFFHTFHTGITTNKDLTFF